MEVILRENISALGHVGDIVKVKSGYARNYLFPQRLAYLATDSNKKRLEAERKALEAKEEERGKAAEQVAKKIEALSLTIVKQAGEEDKLYGSVTASDIEKLMSEQGIKLDRRMITFADAIKTLGDHEVQIHVHADVVATLKFTVVQG